MAFEELIGTGETRTTIQAWEDSSVPADLTSGGGAGIYIGECKAEAFAGGVVLDGHTTDATHYYELTAQESATHDGRANEAQETPKGNARVESSTTYPISLRDEYTIVSWLELYGPGDNESYGIYTSSNITGGNSYIHHCIIHNNGANAGASYGIYFGDTSSATIVYRCIIYGFDLGCYARYGLDTSALYNNTIFGCNVADSASYAGVRCAIAAAPIKNNAVVTQVHRADFYDQTGVLDYNADSDGSETEGAHSITVTPDDEFVKPTTTWADTDLLLKAGADCIGAGADLSATGLPEIDVPIHDRSATVTNWDIGADEYIAGGTAYDRTANDALGLTDAATRVGDFDRTAAEALGLSDAAAPVGAFVRSASDGLGLADAAAQIAEYARTVADGEAIADAATRLADFARTAADDEGLTDAPAVAAAYLRTVADDLGIADSGARIVEFARTVAEAEGLTDASARIAEFTRTVAEAEGLTDASGAILGGGISAAVLFVVLQQQAKN